MNMIIEPLMTTTNFTSSYKLPDGTIHREDGPAIMYPNGTLAWVVHGELHREGGPAIVYPDGEMMWFSHNMRHRTDGPAVICSNGSVEYWIDGDQYDPLTFLMKSYEYTNQA